jgi:hypothetical protein
VVPLALSRPKAAMLHKGIALVLRAVGCGLLSATGEIPVMVRSGGLSLLTNTPNDPADPLRQASQCTDLITRRPTSHRVSFAGSSESTTPFGDPV